jgi:predicted RND superfamily exporter protein
MKVTAKIFILVLSIALAIGGVMVYAKTRVEPPVAFQPINQFEKDLNHLYSDLKKACACSGFDFLSDA